MLAEQRTGARHLRRRVRQPHRRAELLYRAELFVWSVLEEAARAQVWILKDLIVGLKEAAGDARCGQRLDPVRRALGLGDRLDQRDQLAAVFVARVVLGEARVFLELGETENVAAGLPVASGGRADGEEAVAGVQRLVGR